MGKKIMIGIAGGIILGILLLGGKWKNDTVMSQKMGEMEQKASKLQRAACVLDQMEGEGNLLFSPISLDMTLGMVAEGANGETLRSLETFLGSDNYAADALQYMNRSGQQQDISGVYGFKLCNSFWGNEKTDYKNQYQERLETYFKADIHCVDFADKKVVKEINEWCAQRTDGQIIHMVDELDRETSAVFLNAAYFSCEWERPWETVPGEFVNAAGGKQELEVLKTSECSRYYENRKAVGFSKKYKDNYEFVGILPKKEGEFKLEELDLDSLMESASSDYNVEATMPRISMEIETEMADILKRCGLTEIFDKTADFSRLTEEKVMVTRILQACELKLDQDTTTASSASAVVMEKGEAVKNQKKVCLNRPFAFLIRDTATQQIIYMGKILELSDKM